MPDGACNDIDDGNRQNATGGGPDHITIDDIDGGDAAPGANEKYNEELKKLTAAEWLKTFR